MEDDALTAVFYDLVLAPSIRTDFALSLMYHIDTPMSRQLFHKLLDSIAKQGTDNPFYAWGQRLRDVPLKPVLDWTPPHMDEEFARDWAVRPFPFELCSPIMAAKEKILAPKAGEDGAPRGLTSEELDSGWHDWTLLACTVTLESAWAGFYATGNDAYVRKVMECAYPWAEFDAELGIEYIVNLQKPIPASIKERSSATSVRAQVSRIALWSLMHHMQRHTEVTTALADEIAALAPYMLDAEHREPLGADLSRGSVQARMTLFPSLLHLASRFRMDNPDA
jgi:hypothetical protein